ncbi:F-box only protein 47 [Aplysia californica]|uniref:F-box only protein 47 n=1 Tax=Aplysia californica TaxID=6500 RepID=A0ABM0K0J3_APLCA|nr:F-box only protein 47 [Aplysia californica]
MDIKHYMPNKKPRRSDRLNSKEKAAFEETIKVNMLNSCILGYFDYLPIELKFRILRFLTVEDLSILTISSKAMRNLVEGYRVTQFSGPHRIPYEELHSSLSVEEQAMMLSRFHKLGLLMKRSTCVYATKDRLKIVNEFLTRMECSNVKTCKDMSRCIALLCFGKFLHTVIAGWDDSECQRVFDSLCQHMCVHRLVKAVVANKPGLHSHIEVKVRHFFRRIFLDPCGTVLDKAFWITRVLKPWPLVFQARLLYLLYSGHCSGGEIQWHEMSENTPSDLEQSTQYFGNVSSILQILYMHSVEWSSDEVICLIDEMISTPEDWLVENIAGLLLACGEPMATKMLASRAINGRYVEVASIVASLCLVCVKHSNNSGMSQVMVMLKRIVSVVDNWKDRLLLLCRISDTFKELILDTHEFIDSDDGNDAEFYHHVTAMTEFAKQMTHLAFKNVLEV